MKKIKMKKKSYVIRTHYCSPQALEAKKKHKTFSWYKLGCWYNLNPPPLYGRKFTGDSVNASPPHTAQSTSPFAML